MYGKPLRRLDLHPTSNSFFVSRRQSRCRYGSGREGSLEITTTLSYTSTSQSRQPTNYYNVRQDEIIRITSTLVLVHDRTESRKLGDRMGEVRQCTEAEEKLSNIYRMHGIIPHPLEKIQSVVHPKPPSKMTLLRINQLYLAYQPCRLDSMYLPLSHFKAQYVICTPSSLLNIVQVGDCTFL